MANAFRMGLFKAGPSVTQQFATGMEQQRARDERQRNEENARAAGFINAILTNKDMSPMEQKNALVELKRTMLPSNALLDQTLMFPFEAVEHTIDEKQKKQSAEQLRAISAMVTSIEQVSSGAAKTIDPGAMQGLVQTGVAKDFNAVNDWIQNVTGKALFETEEQKAKATKAAAEAETAQRRVAGFNADTLQEGLMHAMAYGDKRLAGMLRDEIDRQVKMKAGMKAIDPTKNLQLAEKTIDKVLGLSALFPIKSEAQAIGGRARQMISMIHQSGWMDSEGNPIDYVSAALGAINQAYDEVFPGQPEKNPFRKIYELEQEPPKEPSLWEKMKGSTKQGYQSFEEGMAARQKAAVETGLDETMLELTEEY